MTGGCVGAGKKGAMEADRIEQFKSDVADMRSKGGRAGREMRWELVGIALMAIAAVAAFVAYEASRSQSDPRNIESGIILAIAMLVLAVIGAAVFLRYSIARFLRFWLLRQMYEGQTNTDRMVDAAAGGARTDPRRGRYGAGAGPADRAARWTLVSHDGRRPGRER